MPQHPFLIGGDPSRPVALGGGAFVPSLSTTASTPISAVFTGPPAPASVLMRQAVAMDPLHTADEWCWWNVHGGGPGGFPGGAAACPAPEDFGFTGDRRFAPVSQAEWAQMLGGFAPPPIGGFDRTNGVDVMPFGAVPFLPGAGGLGLPAGFSDLLGRLLPRLPLPGMGGAGQVMIPPIAGAARRVGSGIAAKIAAMTAAGLTGAQIAQLMITNPELFKPKRRKRGISAAQLTGFKRVSRMLCDWQAAFPSPGRRKAACPTKRRCK